jgi:lysophospholipase L1-like esterase
MLTVNGQHIISEFKDAPWHFGTYHAGTDSEFLPTDTRAHFEKLCETQEYREYFRAHGWLEPGSITYKINSQGFRSEEFTHNTDCIVALGCSFTVGIGLPIESTWPALVGQALGIKVYNLAWGGNSADTCFRLAEYWVPRLKPKAVFMLAPPESRFELLLAAGPHKVEVFMPAAEIADNHGNYADYLKHWYGASENSRLNHKKNKLAISALCNDLDTPCQIYNANDYMAWSREEVGYARDRMHAGPKGHQLLAERIIHDWHETKTA